MKAGKAYIYSEPATYWDAVAPLPDGFIRSAKPAKESLDFAHVFVKESSVFEKEFLKVKGCLKKDGSFWVSWPKRASKVPTDLDENIIRDFGLANGLVDVKVCAVDEVWSGLKFMFRLKDR